ncbi:hypothetical protein LT493_18485 [Streptomyces tricolor]|nr:hypothetical protein [Streptomyces tricolor]
MGDDRQSRPSGPPRRPPTSSTTPSRDGPQDRGDPPAHRIHRHPGHTTRRCATPTASGSPPSPRTAAGAALLAEQAHRLRVRTVAVAREDVVPALREALPPSTAAGSRCPRYSPARRGHPGRRLPCHTVLNGHHRFHRPRADPPRPESGRTLTLANKKGR